MTTAVVSPAVCRVKYDTDVIRETVGESFMTPYRLSLNRREIQTAKVSAVPCTESLVNSSCTVERISGSVRKMSLGNNCREASLPSYSFNPHSAGANRWKSSVVYDTPHDPDRWNLQLYNGCHDCLLGNLPAELLKHSFGDTKSWNSMVDAWLLQVNDLPHVQYLNFVDLKTLLKRPFNPSGVGYPAAHGRRAGTSAGLPHKQHASSSLRTNQKRAVTAPSNSRTKEERLEARRRRMEMERMRQLMLITENRKKMESMKKAADQERNGAKKGANLSCKWCDDMLDESGGNDAEDEAQKMERLSSKSSEGYASCKTIGDDGIDEDAFGRISDEVSSALHVRSKRERSKKQILSTVETTDHSRQVVTESSEGKVTSISDELESIKSNEDSPVFEEKSLSPNTYARAFGKRTSEPMSSSNSIPTDSSSSDPLGFERRQRREIVLKTKVIRAKQSETDLVEEGTQQIQKKKFNATDDSDEDDDDGEGGGRKSSTSRLVLDIHLNVPPLPEVSFPMSAGSQRSSQSRLSTIVPPESRRESTLNKLNRRRPSSRRLRAMRLMQQRMKGRHGRTHGSESEDDQDLELEYDDYDWLAKYCILNASTQEYYGRIFDQFDTHRYGHLNCSETIKALRSINKRLTESHEKYMYTILELVNYRQRDGADCKLFSVLAALSQKISHLDDWMQTIIEQTDLTHLSDKLYVCKTLWECSFDPATKAIPLDVLCLELRAGGVSYEHECQARRRLAHLGSLQILDFLIYIPLFVMIHESVVDNPLDDSRLK